jgi:Ca2+-binding EF-hand superfamily protein
MGCCGSERKSITTMKLDLSRAAVSDDQLKQTLIAMETTITEHMIKMQSNMVFARFDCDQNGYLDKSEIYECLKASFSEQKIEIKIDEKFVTEFFQEFDTSKDELIEPDELQNYFQVFFKHLKQEMRKEFNRRKLKI